MREFYGQSFSPSIQAMVVSEGDRVKAVIGIARKPDHYVLFSDFREEFRPNLPRLAVMRALKRVTGWMEEKGAPVMAVASAHEPKSKGLLERMGFEHYGSAPDGEVYIWQP